MARINVPEGEGLERSRLWKLAPDVGKGVGMTGTALYTKISLDTRVREIARMRVAQINQCHI
jgi:alkylhydroperoxidase family enzyme